MSRELLDRVHELENQSPPLPRAPRQQLGAAYQGQATREEEVIQLKKEVQKLQTAAEIVQEERKRERERGMAMATPGKAVVSKLQEQVGRSCACVCT